MKHMYKYFFALLLLVLVGACGSDKSEMLQKKWKMDADAMLEQLPPDERKNLTKEDVNMFKELMADLYVEFKKDGKFESNMKGETVQGTWKMSDDAQLLITDVDKRKDTLKVLEFTDKKLVLSPNGEDQKLILVVAQ